MADGKYSVLALPGLAEAVSDLTYIIHNRNVAVGWWTDPKTGEDLRHSTDGPKRNVGEMLALVHSEISEALEGYRKDKMDDHLPHRKNMEVELADAVIRICDLAAGMGYDLGSAIIEKMEFNAQRADHKMENRNQPGGKLI